MSYDEIKTGSVIDYPYLWGREAAKGETEGRKGRETAVGLRFSRKDGSEGILLFPITSQPQSADRFAVEIPAIEKKRAGLETDLRLWLVLDEYNYDVVGESFYLESTKPLGEFSKAFLGPLMKEFVVRRENLTLIDRTAT